MPLAYLRFACVLATALTLSARAQEPTDPWLTRPTPKVVEATSFADPAGRFALDYPKKDWWIAPAGYAALVTLNHKNAEASISLERQELLRPMSSSSMNELFVTLQTQEIQKLDPLARDIKARLIEAPPRRVPVFEYRRPAGKENDYVRIYFMPHGPYMYRLVCRSAEARYQKFEPAFALVAASLKVKEAS